MQQDHSNAYFWGVWKSIDQQSQKPMQGVNPSVIYELHPLCRLLSTLCDHTGTIYFNSIELMLEKVSRSHP